MSALLLTLAALAASPPAPGCRGAERAQAVTIALDRALVRGFNGDGFIVSGIHPARLDGDRLTLPVASGDGGGPSARRPALVTRGALFLHAGAHRVTIDRFQLRRRHGAARVELHARVGTPTRRATVALATLPAACAEPARFTRAGARALRAVLRTTAPRAGALLGRVRVERE